MQQENTKKSGRRSVAPKAAGKSSSRNAAQKSDSAKARSSENSTRSFRQNATRNVDVQQGDARPSKPAGRPSLKPTSRGTVAKHPSPSGKGLKAAAKKSAPQTLAVRTGKNGAASKGKTASNSPKSSPAKQARSGR